MKRFWIIFTIFLTILVCAWHPLWTLYSDLRLEYNFRFSERWKPYMDQLPLTLTNPDHPVSVCFVTLDTRGPTVEYIDLHNRNLEAYVQHQNAKPHRRTYTYRFETDCNCPRFKHTHNPYWCKFFLLRELLEDDAFDYVVWMDSDTAIADFEVDFANVLNSYQGHCFVGLDKPFKYDILSAGEVGFRNSVMGRQILRTITETYNQDGFQERCVVKQSKSLRGIFAHSCYGQGVMNKILYKQSRDYTTVLQPKYIHNSKSCDGQFIIHVYGSSNEVRANCFRQYVPSTDHSVTA